MTTFSENNRSTLVDSNQHKIMKRQKKLDEDNKPKRKRITPEQFCLLTELFQQTDTPSHEIRERLAKRLDMTNREVQVWFQNRRAKVNRLRVQEQEPSTLNNDNSKKVKFNYWSTTNHSGLQSPITTTASSSSSSSSKSSPCLPHELVFHPDVTPIDILATAAAYVQQWDEEEQQRKRKLTKQEPKKYKTWRPWL